MHVCTPNLPRKLGAGSGSALELEHLDGLRQDQLAVHALRAKEANLPSGGKELIQALEGTTLKISDQIPLGLLRL